MLDEHNYSEAYVLLEELGENEVVATNKYERALKLLADKEYDNAYALLKEIGREELIVSNKRDRANELLDSEDYDSAYILFKEIGDDDTISLSKYERALVYLTNKEFDKAQKFLLETKNDKSLYSSKYEKALEYIKNKEYLSAYYILESLQSYKDCNSLFISVQCELIKEKLINCEVGDIITFGTYDQDSSVSGKEEISWIVLKREDDKLLLISEKILSLQRFNTDRDGRVGWNTCTLRTWLNESFFSKAFSEAEQTMIPQVLVTADVNPEYPEYDRGTFSYDKVFILSYSEAEELFFDDTERISKPTQKATKSGDHIGWWWLRTPGTGNRMTFVNARGGLATYGYFVDTGDPIHGNPSDDIGVRPVIWLDLK